MYNLQARSSKNPIMLEVYMDEWNDDICTNRNIWSEKMDVVE